MPIDVLGRELCVDDLVIIDLRGIGVNLTSDVRAVGTVVHGSSIGPLRSLYVKFKHPKSKRLLYVEISEWRDHIKKLDMKRNEYIDSKYFHQT